MGRASPLVRARSAPRGNLPHVVITVPRKEAPRAVTRNRIRRRLRAALARAGIRPRGSVVLIGGAGAAHAPFEELLEETRKAMRHCESHE